MPRNEHRGAFCFIRPCEHGGMAAFPSLPSQLEGSSTQTSACLRSATVRCSRIPVWFEGGVRGYRELEGRRGAGEDGVIGVDQLDLHLVLARREVRDVDRVVVARIRPPERAIIDGDVQVPNTR